MSELEDYKAELRRKVAEVTGQPIQPIYAVNLLSNKTIAARLHDLNRDEYEATNGYGQFLSDFEGILDQEDVKLIEHIISEELKHVIINDYIRRKYDTGIFPEGDKQTKNMVKLMLQGMKEI